MKTSHLGPCQAAASLQPAIWTLLICCHHTKCQIYWAENCEVQETCWCCIMVILLFQSSKRVRICWILFRPQVFHSLIRVAVGSTGIVCMLIGIRAGTAQNPVESGIVFGVGAAFNWLAARLSAYTHLCWDYRKQIYHPSWRFCPCGRQAPD